MSVEAVENWIVAVGVGFVLIQTAILAAIYRKIK
jgi:hypothetical protein